SAEGEEVLSRLDRVGIMTTQVSELVAMAAKPPAGTEEQDSDRRHQTQIVELKAVGPGYPFYGTLVLDPPVPLDRLLHPGPETCGAAPCLGAVVQESLLIRMGLALGQRVNIGQATFVLTGLVRLEPDRMANAFSLGPRVMISREGLKAAELVKPGSRVRERRLLKLPEGMPFETVRTEMKERLSSDAVRVSGYRDAQPQLKRFLDQLSRYLGLIGLTALFIGGIGVAMSIHAFVRDKVRTIAILKTLGADTATVVRTYVVQALGLGVVGSVAGMAGGIILQLVLPPLLTDVFSAEILNQLGVSAELSSVSVWPLVKGGLLGLLATLLFSMWPLLGIRTIKPAAIFRQEVEAAPTEAASRWKRWRPRDPAQVFTALLLLIGLGGLSIWQAGAWKIGLLFIAGLSLAVLVLFGCATLVTSALARLPKPRSLALHYAVSNVVRPGGQTAGILLAIGLAVTIIITVSLVERALLRQVAETRPIDAPTFFFIDIQPDQKSDFVRVVDQHTGGVKPELIPVVRSRLHAIDGESVRVEEDQDESERGREENNDARQRQWYRSREYVLTYLDRLPKGNEILDGRWWSPEQAAQRPLLSVEEEAARAMQLRLGSLVEFDIQGTTVAAEVASIRKVDWGSFSTNFYMILSPGSLEGAPLTYIATIHVPPSQEVPIQQAVVAAFPNVSAIHVGDVIENFGRVLDRLSLALRAVALFCLLAAGVVMAAALAATRYRRLYESVIFKTMGATRSLLAGIFAAEYIMLGFVGGTVAAALSAALSWLVLRYIFDLSWTIEPIVLLSGLLLTIAVTLTVGCLSTFRLLGERPLTILRRE
ncbi:MAG TPA: FtsX-like permease family protein, partial [Nitrospira sp.]|nr:FtsX-like permease family protein [Nitrospira sp.]